MLHLDKKLNALLLGFVFFSGLTCLVYQILWMKQLGLLFGNTAHAAATGLAAFFGGLALGSWFWGKRSARLKHALKTYAWLEAGIAVTALLYFFILAAYYQIYPSLYHQTDSAGMRLAVKFLLALVLILPPAFFMGGTIPVMGQFLIRHHAHFGQLSAWLYFINTLGAAAGALLAGFFLPLWLGFRATCLTAMILTSTVAIMAWTLAKSNPQPSQPYRETREETAAAGTVIGLPRWMITYACFLSGFGFLALEVLWTRMFAQVLENSVYTFSSILVIVLLSLAAGAAISARLAKRKSDPGHMLLIIILLGGTAVTLTPYVFMACTNNLQILVLKGSWPAYLALIFKNGFLTVAPPALLLGTLFPFLMKLEEAHSLSAGQSLGRLASINTAGAILGSLVCGFILLEQFGMWGSMHSIALLYLLSAVGLAWLLDKKPSLWTGACVGMLLLSLTLLNPRGLPINSVDPMRPQEEIIETWEGSDCTVAVSRSINGLSIKINSHYGLGSTGAFIQQKLQSDIPLMIHPETKSIFFLGMGTGITAGQSLHSPFADVTRIVVCELVPEVITAARKYMTDVAGQDYTGGLFTSDRATVLAEDGRHVLMASQDRFDMINADLFVPFRSGAGSLYTREHFEAAKARLEPGGLFVQWLPLYQVTENEVYIIARTMIDVFPQVSLWRHSFQPGEEVIGLVGHQDKSPLPPSDFDSQADKLAAVRGKSHRQLDSLSLPFNPGTILFFYAGNLSEARELFTDTPVNTDDRPLIEYMAPRSYRADMGTDIPWFVGPRIARLVEAVQAACPPAEDPLLVQRSQEDRRLPLAGSAYYQARLWEVIGDEGECIEAWQTFVREYTNQPR
jgi:spermidine synthase